jgi:threonine aldolase
MIIELRSDTMTRPDARMLVTMMKASVGDDCYGEDPTVLKLEAHCAELFGKQSALFMPSGTMSNQVALRALTQPGDEVIVPANGHFNFFEAAATADLAGVTVNPVDHVSGRDPETNDDGILSVADVKRMIATRARWNTTYAVPGLIAIENTVNGAGGTIVPLDAMAELASFARRSGVPVYLDGARLHNACVATGVSPRAYAAEVYALSICFSKGLSAPFGSMLMGPADFIERARKYRKWYGGGLHQAGYMAAAALYAIQNNVDRLAEDHAAAHRLYQIVTATSPLCLREPQTNIVMMRCGHLGITAAEIVAAAHAAGVALIAWSADCVRAVTSRRVTTAMAETAGGVIAQVVNELRRPRG